MTEITWRWMRAENNFQVFSSFYALQSFHFPLSLPSILSFFHPSPPPFLSFFSILFLSSLFLSLLLPLSESLCSLSFWVSSALSLSFWVPSLSLFLSLSALSLSLSLKKQKFCLFFPTLADVIIFFPQRISLSLSLSLSWWRKHSFWERVFLCRSSSLYMLQHSFASPNNVMRPMEELKQEKNGWEWRTQERITLTMGMNYTVLSSNCMSSFLELYEFFPRIVWVLSSNCMSFQKEGHQNGLHSFINETTGREDQNVGKKRPAITVFFSFSHFPFLDSFHHSSLKLCTSRIFQLLSQSLLLRENLSNQFFMSGSICMNTQQSPC